MFGFQHLTEKLDQSDLNDELTWYAEMAKANIESEEDHREVRKYPAAINFIAILNAANLLSADNRQLFIDLLFACKTITYREHSAKQFETLGDILRLLNNNQLLTTNTASKIFGDITALNELTEIHQALHDQHTLTGDGVQAILEKNPRFHQSM